MPGRKFSSNGYRYGFNGKEKDDEINSIDGAYDDFGARMYDSRLGRFMRTDPAHSGFSFETPYAFAGNTPVWAIDKDGEKIYFINQDGTILDLSISGNIDKVDDLNFKAAYTTLKKTDLGKNLLDFYESNANGHDIYFKTSKGHAYHGNYVAGTYYDAKSLSLLEDDKIVGLGKDPLSFSDLGVFNGTDMSKSIGKTIDLIGLSNERFKLGGFKSTWSDPKDGGDGKWHGGPALNKYELAESIYHEIFAHILLPTAGGYAKKEDKGDIDHGKYGSKHTGLNPNGYTPYNMISRQLLLVMSMENEFVIQTVEITAYSGTSNSGDGNIEEISPAYNLNNSGPADPDAPK